MSTLSPPTIRDPFTLLYWLFFRPLALRRYVQSIHDELDEDLEIWKVATVVGADPRFQALCRARRTLLLGAPLTATLLLGGIVSLFIPGFAWSFALLSAVGWTVGTALGDWWLSRPPTHARKRMSWLGQLGLGLGLGLVFVWAMPIALFVLQPDLSLMLVAFTVIMGMIMGVVMVVLRDRAEFRVDLILFMGMIIGVVMGVVMGAVPSVVVGAVVGGALGMGSSVDLGRTRRMIKGLVKGVFGGVVVSLPFALGLGVIGGVAFVTAYTITFLRLPTYVWELPFSLWLSKRAVQAPASAAYLWQYQPLHYDEMIQLPLVGLPHHIAAIARTDPERCREALADVAALLRQGWCVPRALRLIALAELDRCTTLEQIERFSTSTAWIPLIELPEAEQRLVANLRQISHDVTKSRTAVTHVARAERLRAQINALRESHTFVRYKAAHLKVYTTSIQRWEQVITEAVNAIVPPLTVG